MRRPDQIPQAAFDPPDGHRGHNGPNGGVAFMSEEASWAIG